jgi:hypothetical protein
MNFNLFPALNSTLKKDNEILNLNLNKHRVNIDEITNLYIIKKRDIFYTDKELLISGSLINNGHLIIKNNGIKIMGDGSLKNNGDLTFISDKKITFFKSFFVEKTTTGDYQETGFFIDECINYTNGLKILVTGPDKSSLNWEAQFDFTLGKKFETPCYFSNDGGLTAKDKIERGDQLYWNSSFAGFDLYRTWNIKIFV